ncbi:peptide-methionine (R)-S-oxide reductase MsrB [Candidatus Saccharibacteria bacterium]|nr:peptide-methionine (R)-S-oxide reductase MsrB [Candidatus Saccharibacteria bacterium]
MTKQFKEDQIKQKLTPQQYEIMIEKGTEMPFTGQYLKHNKKGMYTCALCGAELFSSDTKFDSGSGWPSFYNVVNNKAVKLTEDRSQGLRRVEISCASCGSHLGHVFNDAPDQPTGMRFCINSACLDFEQKAADNEGSKT